MMRSIVWSIVVMGAVGCGPGIPDVKPPHQVRDRGVEALIAATERGDAAAIAGLFEPQVGFGGMWFDDPACRKQFPDAGVVEGKGRAALAKCLAKHKLVWSDRASPRPQVAVLTYAPGLEVEVVVGEREGAPRIAWLGYVGRRDAKGVLPMVTQRALEGNLLEGALELDAPVRAKLDAELGARKLPFGAAWLKICVDAAGVVTDVHGRRAMSGTLHHALVAAVRRWTFRPFVLGGQAVPVCALSWFDYPRHAAPAVSFLDFPEHVPELHAAALVVDGQALERMQGDAAIVPDDDAKNWLRARRIDRVESAFFFCVTPEGTVDAATAVRPTGVPGYDERITKELARWRYKPYVVDGRPVRACTHVAFVYTLSG